MNKERLIKLAQRLDKTPREKFDMKHWCGTACCIAGHAFAMGRKPRPPERNNSNGDIDPWTSEARPLAATYLGLSPFTAAELMDWNWRNDNATPKQAAKVIRHLIRTGKVEWERFV